MPASTVVIRATGPSLAAASPAAQKRVVEVLPSVPVTAIVAISSAQVGAGG